MKNFFEVLVFLIGIVMMAWSMIDETKFFFGTSYLVIGWLIVLSAITMITDNKINELKRR